MTDVVAALIWDNDRFLACQRPAHKARGLLWEFVGGKVEPGETKQAALIRECKEELDITVAVGEVFMELIHEYPDLTVHLTLFNASVAKGTPKRLEHNDIRWLRTDEVDDYTFCPADEEILTQLRQINNSLQARLFALRDPEYKAFQCKLMPTVDPAAVMGIRTPALRQFARAFAKEGRAEVFLSQLPHTYYEENNLHGMLISQMRDYDPTVKALEAFLPYVDNWATCDLISPKSFQKHPAPLLPQIRRWMASTHCYTVRFGIGMLLKFYLDEEFQPEQLAWVAAVSSGEYYVNMMIAWYFATALAKQYDAALPYIQEGKLDPWVHNKAIQKAIESYRVTDEQKDYLRTHKRK